MWKKSIRQIYFLRHKHVRAKRSTCLSTHLEGTGGRYVCESHPKFGTEQKNKVNTAIIWLFRTNQVGHFESIEGFLGVVIPLLDDLIIAKSIHDSEVYSDWYDCKRGGGDGEKDSIIIKIWGNSIVLTDTTAKGEEDEIKKKDSIITKIWRNSINEGAVFMIQVHESLFFVLVNAHPSSLEWRTIFGMAISNEINDSVQWCKIRLLIVLSFFRSTPDLRNECGSFTEVWKKRKEAQLKKEN